MLKNPSSDRSHTRIPPGAFSHWTHQTAQQGTESNGYRGTGPGERVRSVNERSSHHRVVSGQLRNAQKPVKRPLPHVITTRCVSQIGRTRRLSRAPRVTDIVARGQVSGSDR